MAYPDIVRRTPHVTDLKITEFLDRLLYRATLVRDPPHVFHYPRDPKDEPYFDLAIACNANFLTSRDKDFLSLTDGHSLEAKELRQRCPGLRILTPEDFLKTILTSL
jgi:predicted nucleic acid-binding protein